MSLKAFHLLFIVISIITAGGFGVWCFVAEKAETTPGAMVMGVASLALAAGLVFYAIKFVQKLRREGIE